IKINNINVALKNIRSYGREYEKIYEADYLIIDNYCKDSLDLNLTFETIQNLKYKELIIFWGIEIDEGIVSIKENIDVIISWLPILGVNTLLFHMDNQNKLIEDNIKIMLEKKGVDFSIYYDLKLSIGKGIELLNKNDILLLVGGENLNKAKEIINLELANKF